MKHPCVIVLALAFLLEGSTLQSEAARGWGDAFPSGSWLTEGNSSSYGPFYARYQQVIDAREFTKLREAGGGTIEWIGFRLDSSQGTGWAGTFTDLRVTISTTPKGPDELSSVFEENVGADATVVFGPREWTWGVLPPSGQPQWFEIGLAFEHPFFYDPSKGNLLLDFQTSAVIPEENPSLPYPYDTVNYLDAWDRPDDSVSSVWSWWRHSAGGTSSTVGVVMRIEGQLIPEPNTTLLFLVSGSALWMAWRRNQRWGKRRGGCQRKPPRDDANGPSGETRAKP